MGSTSNGGADASSAFQLHDNTPKLPLMMVRGASSLQQQPPTTWLSGLLALALSGPAWARPGTASFTPLETSSSWSWGQADLETRPWWDAIGDPGLAWAVSEA